MRLKNYKNLETYLFSKPNFDHYGGRIDKLIFGCETEFFIWSESETRTLLTSDLSKILYKDLSKNFGYKVFGNKQGEHRISKDTSKGYISIKPDFAFHIFEISFPPRPNPESLRTLISGTLHDVDTCLKRIGYKRGSTSVLPGRPDSYDLVPLERHKVFIDLLKKELKPSKFSFADYPALMCSTQVHLNILDPTFFEMLPLLYELEWLTIPLFSKSKCFSGEVAGCARALILEHSLGPNYPLKGIPKLLPKNITEYWLTLDSCPKYFPLDAVFSAKDYSYIRPRPFGSVEFRSACTQSDVESILRLCAFRALQAAYALFYKDHPIQHENACAKSVYLNRANNSEATPEQTLFEQTVLSRIKAIPLKLLSEWSTYLDPILDSIKIA